jgi:hypothetical protein
MISTHRIMPASHTRQWWLAGGIHPSQVVAAYQPKGAASLGDSYVNLANPGTNDAQVGVAPTLDGSGWVFNGATQYLIGPPINAAGMLIRYSDVTAIDFGVIAGAQNAGNIDAVWLRPLRSAADLQIAIGPSTSTVVYANPGSFGVIGFNGSASYRNGVVLKSNHTPTTLTHNIGIGASLSEVLLPSTRKACKVQAFCSFASGTTLTAAQIAALSSAMAAL